MKDMFLSSVAPEEALKRLFDHLDAAGLTAMPSEEARVVDSLHRITARPVFAKYSSPFFHSAAMDGYAVTFRDTFTASEKEPCHLRLGKEAFYVDTGDPLPEGCNAVIMIEDVNRTEDIIEIYQPVTPYQHVRVIGEDIVATELILPENHRIRPIDVGAMLASGHLEIGVRRRPVVGIIPTGTEIIDAETVRTRPPHPPEIIEYNSAVLGGLAVEEGARAVRYDIVPDDVDMLRSSAKRALDEADVVLINAGSGKGSEDYTARIIGDLGTVLVHSVSIKPGKPVIIGIAGGKAVFGIPGYPVSAFIGFSLFVKPLIRRLLGTATEGGERLGAIISRQVSSPLGVEEFIRVKVGDVGGKHVATPVGRGAGLLMSLVRADGMMRIPAGSEGYTQGSKVDVELIRSKQEIRNTIVCIGSHDNSLDILANTIKKTYPAYSLSSSHVGSMGGLMAIKRGEAHMAGTHLLDEETGEYNVPYIRKLLPDKKTILVNLVYREQGLLVKKGNPKRITGFADLTRDDVVFINRQSGSGTRLLLDKYLKDLGIDSRRMKGYDSEEYTHMAVASAVLTGRADTGLAIDSSAKALGLDFIPVAQERYDLLIPGDIIDTEMIRILLWILRDDQDFRKMIQSLGGYDTRDMGKVLYEG